jgi:catechol 2,3-dioxygenase-like lactoylglutathione lyase family enzyme
VLANPFSHLDLRVRDLEAAFVFYKAFLPMLGFTRIRYEVDWKGFVVEDVDFPERSFFGLHLDVNHRPNSNRVAFWVDSPAKVDAVQHALEVIHAPKVEGPMLCTEYSPDYYAVFFEDPSGNLLEVVYRTR